MSKTQSKAIINNLEAMRQSGNPKTIESKLHEITKNANLKTRDKYPQPSEAEARFRDYVDRQVDSLNRLSTNNILVRMKGRHIYAGDIS